MKICALNYDLARSRRADLPHLKGVVDRLVECRFNGLSLYLEHRFDFPSCPGVAPPGSLTPAMARELTAYGREKGVAVIPQFNLIGHCEGIGATERYAHLTCDPHQQIPWGGYEQLNLDRPETRAFVRAAIGDLCEAFPGDTVHIGDEVRQMAWLYPGDSERQQAAMVEWLEFVAGEAKRRGRRVWMWGDMPLHHESVMARLPRDLVMCDWHYGEDGSRATLERFQREGFPVLAAPAVSTCSGFGVSVETSLRNIEAMAGDAVALGLEGLLLATWEFGFGSGPGQVWPFVAYAGAIAAGERPPSGEAFVADYVRQQYGVGGAAYLRLLALLSSGLEAALTADLDRRPDLLLVTLRKALFRDTSPFPDAARPKPAPANRHRFLWDPGPFGCWLFLRPILTPAVMARVRTVADEATMLAAGLRRKARAGIEELESVLVLAEALSVMADELLHLEAAKACYHEAAVAQQESPARFRDALDRTASHLDRLRPGLARLRRGVDTLDATAGLDAAERDWIDRHEESLDAHIAALRACDPAGDSLLEFGEFLRRPARIRARLTWR